MADKTKRLDIAGRRAAVARFAAKGCNTSEIAYKLNKLGYTTLTGTKLTANLINKDLKDIEKLWMQTATADIGRHKARQFNELQKVKQVAWDAKNYDLVLKVLDKEMALLGTKVTAVDKEQPRYVKNETNQQFNIITDQQRIEGISKILESARERKATIASGCGAGVEAPATTTQGV